MRVLTLSEKRSLQMVAPSPGAARSSKRGASSGGGTGASAGSASARRTGRSQQSVVKRARVRVLRGRNEYTSAPRGDELGGASAFYGRPLFELTENEKIRDDNP